MTSRTRWWPAAAAALTALPAARSDAQVAQLDTVRVSSRAAALPRLPDRTVEVLGRPEIARIPARTIADVLARALGADLGGRSPASGDLAIRGSSFEQVLVLVDGVRVSDDQTGHFDLDLAVPLDMVERVEILRGTGSALYGPDAVGGVVNVVTRRGADGARAPRATARLQSGTFNTVGGALTATGRGAAIGSDYLQSTGHRPGTDYRIHQARGSWGGATPAGRLNASVGHAVRDFGAADFYGPYPSHERTRTGTAAVRLDAAPRPRLALSAALSTRRHTDRFTLKRSEPSFYQNVHESWQSGGEGVLRLAVTRSVALAAGTELYASRLASARLGDRREHRGAAFSEVTVGGERAGRVTGGVRVDRSSRFGAFVSPSLAVARALGAAVQLRASAARGFRAPTWTERYYVDPANRGDPALRPETFWTREVGVAAAAPGDPSGVRVDVAAFEREARDLIDWARPADAAPATPWQTTNVERATFRGAELKARLPRALGVDWTLRGMALSVDASARSGLVGKYALRPVAQSATLAAAAPLGAGIALSIETTHARRVGERAFVRGDARLAYARGRARLTLDLVNLTSARYLDAAARPVAGRAAYLGFEVGAGR